MLLEGIFLPLTTPFHADGRLYLRKLESNVQRYSLTPAAGMLVLGREGEGDGLSDAEAHDVLTTAIRAADDEKVMLASVGRESVVATLTLASIAVEADYDAIVVRAPAFAKDAAMRREVLGYFQAVADRAMLPVVLRSSGARPLSVESVGELVGHPNIIGLVDEDLTPERVLQLQAATADVTADVTVTTIFAAATRRMLRHVETQQSANFVSAESLTGGVALAAPPVATIKTRTKRVGFQLLAGSTGGMLEAWTAGASAAVPPLGPAAPQACCEVWQAHKDGDPALAADKQERIREAGRLVEALRGVAALKYGCDLNAYFGGQPRLPLLPLTAEERGGVERCLSGLKN